VFPALSHVALRARRHRSNAVDTKILASMDDYAAGFKAGKRPTRVYHSKASMCVTHAFPQSFTLFMAYTLVVPPRRPSYLDNTDMKNEFYET
jgi:hypothetical protein